MRRTDFTASLTNVYDVIRGLRFSSVRFRFNCKFTADNPKNSGKNYIEFIGNKQDFISDKQAPSQAPSRDFLCTFPINYYGNFF
jgi:hypothetical protein